MLTTAQREKHEEVGDVSAAERWVLSWLGSGSLHDKDWYLADYALVVKHEDLVSHREAPFSSCSEFIESDWYTAEEVRALVKESEKSIKDANAWDAAMADCAPDEKENTSGDMPIVIQIDRLEERVVAGANARLPEQNKRPGPCIICSTEEQRVADRNRQERAAFAAHCRLCNLCTTADTCSDAASEHQWACNHSHHGRHSTTYLPIVEPQEAPAPKAPEPDAQRATKPAKKTERSTQYATESSKEQRTCTGAPAAPTRQEKVKGGSSSKGAGKPKAGKAPNGNTTRSRGQGLGDPSPLDEQTLELFYATGQGCRRAYYQTQLHLADTPEQRRLATYWPASPGKGLANMGWPSAETAIVTYTYRRYRRDRAHPLNGAGLPSTVASEYQWTAEFNEYVEVPYRRAHSGARRNREINAPARHAPGQVGPATGTQPKSGGPTQPLNLL